MARSLSVLLVAALGLLLLSGCAATPYGELIPVVQPDPAARAASSITVGSVTTSYEYNPLLESTLPKVSAETFRAALTETLRTSGMLAGAGEAYRLSADMLSEQMAGTFDNTITVLIRYELERGGKPVWSENILSQGQLSASDVFAGAERHRRLQVQAFQDNLSTLVTRLKDVIGGK